MKKTALLRFNCNSPETINEEDIPLLFNDNIDKYVALTGAAWVDKQGILIAKLLLDGISNILPSPIRRSDSKEKKVYSSISKPTLYLGVDIELISHQVEMNPKYEKWISLYKCNDQVDEEILDIYYEPSKINNVCGRMLEIIGERLCKHELLPGYKIVRTQFSHDGGYDIDASKIDSIPDRILIECKGSKKGRPVSVNTLRSFAQTINIEKANKGIIFTNTRFSSDAKKFRNRVGKFILILKDAADLLSLIADYVVSKLLVKQFIFA